ncbi:acetylornithine deacetylase [Aaosphaeria arxii CBS 175.79]|uniref:Acetylornithine deacetylase n=1 Tax=Aaosphaeria arxii CBS 175.79 TaxID=1450172 RepID=A0A6A5XT98_9PLEO|nr:acetylornithine deacetylase [Aaosphaeria arxii CBS 175.79]KAF2016047.1 acetylornithine deacetylase [Aaosphaeria arxii CBS 175.79]
MFRSLPLLALSAAAVFRNAGAQASSTPSLLTETESHALLTLHRQLVEIESISQNEGNVSDWLTSYLRSKDWTVEQQHVSPNRTNVFAYSSKSKRHTSILVSSHIDTVPPYWPYYYDEEKDVIGGRGSVDAKGSVAAQIIAAEGLREGLIDDISLLFVVGEEQGGDGMRLFSSWEDRPGDYEIVVFGEPTEAKLVCGHKGIVGFNIKVTGRAAHSGYPWLGVSANDVLLEALGKLLILRDTGGLPWSRKYGNSTMNFGKIVGGVAGNVVAEAAEASVTVRIAAGDPDVIKRLVYGAVADVKKKAEELGAKIEFDWTVAGGYGPVDIDCDIDGFEKFTVNYGTDVPHLHGVEKRYLFGPGSIFVAHSDHEALKRKELEQAVLDYRRLIIAATRVDHQEAERIEM